MLRVCRLHLTGSMQTEAQPITQRSPESPRIAERPIRVAMAPRTPRLTPHRVDGVLVLAYSQDHAELVYRGGP